MKYIFFTLLLFALRVPAQETDIIPYLKLIEEGKQEEAESKLPSLKKLHPNDPSVLFLEAVLTQDAEQAIPIFGRIIEKFPKSRYADASLYRIYSYYFASGLYSKAEMHIKKLKNDYPESPYIKIAERTIPDTDDPVEVTSSDNLMAGEEKNSSEFRFTIQAGAFSNKKNSAHLVSLFRDSGYDTETKEKLVAGTVFEIVYVGKFKTRKEAGELLERINDLYNLDGRVVELNSGH